MTTLAAVKCYSTKVETHHCTAEVISYTHKEVLIILEIYFANLPHLFGYTKHRKTTAGVICQPTYCPMFSVKNATLVRFGDINTRQMSFFSLYLLGRSYRTASQQMLKMSTIISKQLSTHFSVPYKSVKFFWVDVGKSVQQCVSVPPFFLGSFGNPHRKSGGARPGDCGGQRSPVGAVLSYSVLPH
jgi:hypothetical protein